MRKESRRFAARWAGRGSLAFAAAVAVYLFLHSPFFGVQTIDLYGHNFIEEQELLAMIGVSQGDNLLRIDTAQVRRRLEEDPRIGAARVRRYPPNRLVIEIEERLPVAVVPYADGFLFIDGEARLLAADRRSRPGLPAVTGVPLDRIGRHLPPPDELLSAARLAAHMPEAVRRAIAEIHVDENGGMTLFTLGGIPVLMGAPVDLPLKVQVLASLLEGLEDRPASLIDLRVPAAPAIRR